MTDYPCTASDTTTVMEAVELMKRAHIRHLPVLKGGQVIGVVSDRDLKQAEILSDAMTLVVSDVMTADPYCVQVGTLLSEVAREMAKNKYGCTVVLNRMNRVVGIFTTTDGMRILSQLLDSKPEGHLNLVKVEDLLNPQSGFML
jgi:acetoin utilization protein AcuB